MEFEIIANHQQISCFCVSPSEQFLAAGYNDIENKDYSIVLYQVPNFRILSFIPNAHQAQINSIIFTQNSEVIVTGGCDSITKFFETKQPNNSIWQLKLDEDSHVQKLSMEYSGVYLAIADQFGYTTILNIPQRRISTKFKSLGGRIVSIQFIENNTNLVLISGSGSQLCPCQYNNEVTIYKQPIGELKIWNWQKQQLLYRMDQIGVEEIQSVISGQFLLVCRANQGLVEIINFFNVGVYNFSKIDISFQILRQEKIKQIVMFGQDSFILVNVKNQFFQVQLRIQKEILDPEDQKLGRQQFNTFRGNIFKGKMIEGVEAIRRGTQLIGLRGQKLAPMATRMKLESQQVFQSPVQVITSLSLNHQIILAGDDGSLSFLKNDEANFDRVGTSGMAQQVRFSKDGKFIVVGDENGMVLIIEVQTRRIKSRTSAHKEAIEDIDFLNSSSLVSKSKDGTIKTWELDQQGQLQFVNSANHHSDTNISISEDKQFILVGNNDGSLCLYRTNNLTTISLDASQVEITAVAFANNTDLIISANLNKVIMITDFKEKMILKKLTGHQDPIIAITCSPNSTQFSSGGYDCMIKIWSITQSCLLNTLIGHKECVNSLKYTKDGRLLFSCSDDKTIRIWSLAKISSIIVLDISFYPIRSFDIIHEEGTIVFTNADHVVFWKGKQQPVQFAPHQQQQNEQQIAIAWYDEKNTLAVSQGQEVKFLNTEGNVCKSILCEYAVRSIQIQINRLYITCEESHAYIYEDFIILHTFDNVESITSTPSNSQILIGSQKEITVLDGYTLQRKATFQQEWVTILQIGIKQELAGSSDISGEVYIWNINSGLKVSNFQGHKNGNIYQLKFLRFDGYVVTAGESGKLFMWKVDDPNIIVAYEGHSGTVNVVQILNDKIILSGGEDGNILFWQVNNQQLIHTLAVHNQPITQLVVNYDKIGYCFGNSTVILDAKSSILENIQLNSSDCAPLMQTQDIQVYLPNSILSQQLGTVFRPFLKNILIQNEEIQESLPYLNEHTLKKSSFYQKIRSHLLNPKLRDNLLDQFSKSEFLLQNFDDDLAYCIFNETFEMLREVSYDQIGKYVQNMFYMVINNQSNQGSRILNQILCQQKFSCNLSMKELQYLLALIKFLKSHIQMLHNSQKYQVQLNKLQSLKLLNLSRNPFLSSILCKSVLLKNMDKTFDTFRLMTPQEIFQNEYFDLLKNKEYWPQCYTTKRGQKIEEQILQINRLRDKIAEFNVEEYDNYIQDFILELICEFQFLESIDVSYLNLTDEFCERICNFYIDQTTCPDIRIYSNERITFVGKKYLQVLFTKHKRSKLHVQSVNQMQEFEKNIQQKLTQLQSQNFKLRFDEQFTQEIDLLIKDLNGLSQHIQEDLDQIGKQDNLMLNIEDYYDQQCLNLKRQQILLNEGLLGYISQSVFSTSKNTYCTFCNKYVCVICHARSHQTNETCMLCLKCNSYHQGIEKIVECKNQNSFQYSDAKKNLYQQFKYQSKDPTNSICFYGTLKSLDGIEFARTSLSDRFIFKFRCGLFKLISFMEQQIQIFQLNISVVLGKLNIINNQVEQEDIRAILSEGVNILEIDQYNINSNVFDLEEKIQPLIILYLGFLSFVLWYIISISLPLVFPGEQSVQWTSHIIFTIYMILIFFLELIAIITMLRIVNKPLEGEIKLIRDLSTVKYIGFLFTSVLAKYDFYTDVIFATVLYRQSLHSGNNLDLNLFYLSVLFIVLPCTVTWIQILYFFFNEIVFRIKQKNRKEVKTLRLINLYSKVCEVTESTALAWFLDKFASRSAVKIGQRYIPQKIVTCFCKVVFENMPQLIIQLTYQSLVSNEYNFTLILSQLTTCFSLIVQFISLLIAKSSFVNQIDMARMQNRLGKHIFLMMIGLKYCKYPQNDLQTKQRDNYSDYIDQVQDLDQQINVITDIFANPLSQREESNEDPSEIELQTTKNQLRNDNSFQD